MPREHPDYRLNLERLNELYPDHEMLSFDEVHKIMGYKSKDSTRKYVPFIHQRCSKATLARIMCGG